MKLARIGRLGAVLAVALVGVLIGRVSMSAADRPEHRSGSKPAAGPSERSAAVAAIAYLDALRWDVLVDDQERRRIIEAHATAAAAADLDAELEAPTAALRQAVSAPPVVARIAILGYRVLSVDDRRAAVRIWGLALFGTASYKPTTQWSSSDLALVWSRDRWLIDGIENRGGPSPSSGVRALARQSRGLREVQHVP